VTILKVPQVPVLHALSVCHGRRRGTAALQACRRRCESVSLHGPVDRLLFAMPPLPGRMQEVRLRAATEGKGMLGKACRFRCRGCLVHAVRAHGQEQEVETRGQFEIPDIALRPVVMLGAERPTCRGVDQNSTYRPGWAELQPCPWPQVSENENELFLRTKGRDRDTNCGSQKIKRFSSDTQAPPVPGLIEPPHVRHGVCGPHRIQPKLTGSCPTGWNRGEFIPLILQIRITHGTGRLALSRQRRGIARYRPDRFVTIPTRDKDLLATSGRDGHPRVRDL